MSASLGSRSGREFMFSVAGLLALAMLLVAGCTRGVEEKPRLPERQPPKTANDVLERTIEAYHAADSYQDAGRLEVRYVRDGENVEDIRDFSLTLAAPNLLRIRAYDVLAVCDGLTFRAAIDEAPGEVLAYEAPEETSLLTVYRDPVLANALNQIVGSVPLALFLDPDPMPALLSNAHSPQLDTPQKIGDDECYRVRIEKREGPFVLWIDERSFVVRRVEYPAGGYRRLLATYMGPVSDMTIVAELAGARFDEPIDDAAFRFEMPKDGELVKQFDVVRPGARIPKFELRTLDGQMLTRDSLEGKIVVLKFWQKDDVFRYYKDLADFARIQQRHRDDDSIVFLAVSADLDEVSDDELKAAFAKAELSLPIARIERRVLYRSFGVQTAPTTVILGRDGRLQEHTIGVYPNQTATLSKRLETLLAGGDLTLEAPKEAPDYLFYLGFAWQNAQMADEEQQNALAAALAKSGIAPASEPESLRRKRRWTCSELRQPGNILTVRQDSGLDRVFVIEGLPSVAEVDAQGKIAAKHRLELPDRDDSEVEFLRTAIGGDGKRYFLGSKIGVQQLHLFDGDWKRVLSFPEEPDHPGISDALLSDLDGDGNLEMLVGYLQAVGVHCITLDGARLWRNRAAENVFRLAVTGMDRRKQRQLLVAQGILLPIDAEGNERAPINLPNAFVQQIFTADLDGDASMEWCAIVLEAAELGESVRSMAVGLSPRGEELWRYRLPEGTHRHVSFEMVTSGNLLGGDAGQWVIAGADGSIHLLSIDGELIDQFNYGASPSGMAVANLDGQPLLLMATDEAMEAWQFKLPPQDQAPAKE